MVLITEINAQNYVRDIPAGVTAPFILTAEDEPYVCKIGDENSSCRHLVNEYVCYHLAFLLDLPIPPAKLIRVNESLIDSVEGLKSRGVKSDLLFGSKLIEPALPKISPPQIERITNPSDIPSIILFDQIIYNNDRASNDGNLLFDMKQKKILAIDHSHVFKDGLIWDEHTLSQINLSKQYLIENFHGKYYKLLLPFINGYSPFDKILTKISNITEQHINLIIESIPYEWEVTQSEKNVLKSFIWHRLQNIDCILEAIHCQCPQWKGVVKK